MDAPVQAIGGLGIDVVAMQDQAAEARLDVGARTAEAVVEIEMPEGGVEVVAPEQVHDTAAEPHAFGIAGRPGDGTLRLGELIDFLRFFCRFLPGRRRLFRRFGFIALGESQGSSEEPRS